MFEILSFILSGTVRFLPSEKVTTPGACRTLCSNQWAAPPDDSTIPELRRYFNVTLKSPNFPQRNADPFLHLAITYDFERAQWFNENTGASFADSNWRPKYRPFVFPRQPRMQDIYVGQTQSQCLQIDSSTNYNGVKQYRRRITLCERDSSQIYRNQSFATAATTCSTNNDTVWSGNWTRVPRHLLDERVTLWSGIKRINMTHFNVNPIENECNGPPNSTFPPFVTIRLCHPNSTDITCRATNVYDKQTATCMCWTRFLFKDELGILIREVMVAFIFGLSSIVGLITTVIFTVNTFFREKKKKKETSVELEMNRICEVRSP